MNMRDPVEVFLEFAAEFADGERWELLRAQNWDQFQERLGEAVGDLPVRRRQALVMLLFAMVEGFVTSDDLAGWLSDHDPGRDEEVEALIGWLRERRRRATD
jgi:hypothetical protein